MTLWMRTRPTLTASRTAGCKATSPRNTTTHPARPTEPPSPRAGARSFYTDCVFRCRRHPSRRAELTQLRIVAQLLGGIMSQLDDVNVALNELDSSVQALAA